MSGCPLAAPVWRAGGRTIASHFSAKELLQSLSARRRRFAVENSVPTSAAPDCLLGRGNLGSPQAEPLRQGVGPDLRRAFAGWFATDRVCGRSMDGGLET